MRKLLLFAALLLLPAGLRAQSMGATVIVQGGNTAAVTASSNLQVELHNGSTTIGVTGTSLNVAVTGGSGSGASATDEATFTLGSGTFAPAGCYFQTTVSTGALTTGQAGIAQCDANRRLFVVGAGTAGSASGGVVSVQGVASMTALSIRGNAGAAFDAATGAAPPANALLMGGLGSGATNGFMIGIPVSDLTVSKNITSGTTTLIITGVSGRQVRIGAYELWVGAADNVEWIEGTGATCGTGTAGMAGGATTGLSMVFSAAGGLVRGTGLGTVLQTATSGDSVCMVTSTSANVGLNAQYTIY